MDTKLAITLVYAQPSSACSIVEATEQICERLGDRVGIDWRLWRLDLLEEPECFKMALAEALESEIFAVSWSAETDLTNAGLRLADSWASQEPINRPNKLLLVASPTENASAVEDLRQLCAQVGIEFILAKERDAATPPRQAG